MTTSLSLIDSYLLAAPAKSHHVIETSDYDDGDGGDDNDDGGDVIDDGGCWNRRSRFFMLTWLILMFKVAPENYEGDLDFLRKAHHVLLEVVTKCVRTWNQAFASDRGDQWRPGVSWDFKKIPRDWWHT